ncbi:unnamed protein product [Cylicostephanus goldi]|uniref:Uncharacterized protein n=1 Tax=Cylicostephanus goldi TaxID=71465 RepID=A0A3P7MVZ3_CYLGO|nr:unnamed protein product [Cylicostephanus goldi]
MYAMCVCIEKPVLPPSPAHSIALTHTQRHNDDDDHNGGTTTYNDDDDDDGWDSSNGGGRSEAPRLCLGHHRRP